MSFDGTWRDAGEPQGRIHQISHVMRFLSIYEGPKYYSPGVGTRWGRLGRYLGGALGFGSRRRIRDALGTARIMSQGKVRVFDLLGWSRGAGIALTVARLLAKEGMVVRWVGLIDLVDKSLLIPAAEVPSGVRVIHARALDEHRWAFRSKPLTPPTRGLLEEKGFRGNHIDVAGMGSSSTGIRTGVAVIRWLADDARKHGLPI